MTQVTAADLAIIAGLVFAWGTLPTRLERSVMMTADQILLRAGRRCRAGFSHGRVRER